MTEETYWLLSWILGMLILILAAIKLFRVDGIEPGEYGEKLGHQEMEMLPLFIIFWPVVLLCLVVATPFGLIIYAGSFIPWSKKL